MSTHTDSGPESTRLPLLSRLALPYARRELPGWGKVLRAAGIYTNALWVDAPTKRIRGKLHGYRMALSLQSWAERQTYFLGRYFEFDTQAFAMASLHPGDTFIDVGGNIGMLTLLGSKFVGPDGIVHTFEPNPNECERIAATIAENGIANVRLHRLGLSDRDDELTLSVVTEHTGMATFAAVTGDDAGLVSATYRVAVRRGDDVLGADLPGAVTVKMDIEGFECRALAGLEATLRRYRPAVITEVVGQHLRRAGDSVDTLFDFMQGLGYQGYELGTPRQGLRRRLSLRKVERLDESIDTNVGWLYPGSVHEARLAPCMAGSR